jgi:carboxyl-terminal processing protease
MTESTSPATAAYQEISPLRDKHASVIWGGRAASPTELREILADLDTGLNQLSTPLNHDLAEGNVFLRFRRFNFLVDKIIVLDRLGDPLAAIAAWQDLQQMSWFDLASLPRQSERFRGLVDRPEATGIRAQLAAAKRWSKAEPLASPYRETLPVEEHIAGLSRIWAAARDGFVWFDHVPDLDWDRAYLDTIPRVIASEATEAYCRELTRFMALLRDAHSNVYVPKEIAAHFYSRPGVRTAKVQKCVLVMDIIDNDLSQQGLSVGDEILSIDGIDVERYAQDHVAPYQSSSTPQDLETRTYSYALLAGPAERPVQLGVRDPHDRQTTIRAPRSNYQSTARPRELFALREDGIAVLTATQFENRAAAALVDEQMPELMSAKGLIVDLRGNGGGSSHFGFQLLSHLTEASLPSMMSMYRESDALDRARSENIAQIKWRTLERSGLRPARGQIFRGPVAMLIDARTFSAAEDTVAVFRLMCRGIILGSASAGSTGQPWMFDMPGGGSARICVKRDSYPDGTSFVGTGVAPDVEVPLTIEDIRNNRDGALERAVQATARADHSLSGKPAIKGATR